MQESDFALTRDQVTRYSRHMLMPEIGPAGQRELLNSRVLIIGAGGLGSPIAIYLALAGVGTIGIVDHDVVDLSNLQRQILHPLRSVGKLKVESAVQTLAAYNPDVKVLNYAIPLRSNWALPLIAGYDVVVNGADNFPTRYLVNDACYLMEKPLIDGAILQFEGRAVVFEPGKGCYRCLFPEPPEPDSVQNCAEAGVLGALCATIGSIQATEVIKQLLGIGEPLTGRMLRYDALAMNFEFFKLQRNPNCALCGDHPTVKGLVDYEAFCGLPPL